MISIGGSAGSSSFVGTAYVSDTVVAFGGACIKLDSPWYGANIAWGPASCALSDGSTFQRVGGASWVACLLWSPLTIEGAGTGTSYAAGAWTDGIDLTAANLDAHDTLQNPRTGSRFFINA